MPRWLKVRIPGGPGYARTKAIVRRRGLATVCEEAACPNIGECWAKSHATLMIMGEICTRACAFCNVRTGRPGPLDPGEPARAGAAVAEMGLSHVVITSVDRDDLADGGAEHFACVLRAIRAAAPGTTIEALTPDFRNKSGALEKLLAARPDVFNHNLETVPRLYRTIRRGSRYAHSLSLLERARSLAPGVFTKSGLMAGLGESREELREVMQDMRRAGVDFITIGQYLRPTAAHAPVARFVPPEEFDEIAGEAWALGFSMVASGPLVRSSYHAERDFARLKALKARAEH